MARTAGEQPVDLAHRRVELGERRMGERESVVQGCRQPIPSRRFGDQQNPALARAANAWWGDARSRKAVLSPDVPRLIPSAGVRSEPV